MTEEIVPITTDYITLDAFLKWVGAVQTGGQAKALILSGAVQVNGEVERRRGRKLRLGDRVAAADMGRWIIAREEA